MTTEYAAYLFISWRVGWGLRLGPVAVPGLVTVSDGMGGDEMDKETSWPPVVGQLCGVESHNKQPLGLERLVVVFWVLWRTSGKEAGWNCSSGSKYCSCALSGGEDMHAR